MAVRNASNASTKVFKGLAAHLRLSLSLGEASTWNACSVGIVTYFILYFCLSFVNSSLPSEQGGVVEDIMVHTLFLLMLAFKNENFTAVLDIGSFVALSKMRSLP